MANFTRETIIEAVARLEDRTHSMIDRFLLRFGLENIMPNQTLSKSDKVNEIIKHLIANPNNTGPNGAGLTYEVIEFIAQDVPEIKPDPVFGTSLDPDDDPNFRFKNSLAKDGFKIESGELRPILPNQIDLPEKENELILLLDKFNMSTAKGHLEQAISAHTRGDWAASNAQLRTFIEELFDNIATKLIPQGSLPPTGHSRREELARISPPFFSQALNEWEIGNNSGFVQGFWKRLHPQGSHPGLSDEDDNTFRMHIIFLVAHHFLSRLENRLNP